jgi:hypothetical protein
VHGLETAGIFIDKFKRHTTGTEHITNIYLLGNQSRVGILNDIIIKVISPTLVLISKLWLWYPNIMLDFLHSSPHLLNCSIARFRASVSVRTFSSKPWAYHKFLPHGGRIFNSIFPGIGKIVFRCIPVLWQSLRYGRLAF